MLCSFISFGNYLVTVCAKRSCSQLDDSLIFYPPCILTSLLSVKLITLHIYNCRKAVHCGANEGITKALPFTLFHFSYTWDLLGSEESNLIIEHTHYKSLFQRIQLTRGFQLFHLWTHRVLMAVCALLGGADQSRHCLLTWDSRCFLSGLLKNFQAVLGSEALRPNPSAFVLFFHRCQTELYPSPGLGCRLLLPHLFIPQRHLPP